MGDGLSAPESHDIKSYTDLFYTVEPWYLSIGMTLDEFWNGPPRLAKVYRDADDLRRKRANAEAWRAGFYMCSALNATVGNMFRKKGTSPIGYMSEPLPMSQEEVEQREIRDARERERRLIERMEQMVRSGKTSNG